MFTLFYIGLNSLNLHPKIKKIENISCHSRTEKITKIFEEIIKYRNLKIPMHDYMYVLTRFKESFVLA